ncbi:MAG: hypothetical protein ACQEQF_00320 [Bacillota bacterium]
MEFYGVGNLYNETLYSEYEYTSKSSSDSLNINIEEEYNIEYSLETVIASDRNITPRLFISRPDGSWEEVTDYLLEAEVDFGDVDQLGTGNMAGDAVVRELNFTLQNQRNNINGDSFHPMDKLSSWNKNSSGEYSPLLWPLRTTVLRVMIEDDENEALPGNTFVEKEVLQSSGSTQTVFQLDHYPIDSDSVTVYFDGTPYEDVHAWDETTAQDETYTAGDETLAIGDETDSGEEFVNTIFNTDEDVAPYTINEDDGIITFEDDVSTKIEVSYNYYKELFRGYLGDDIDSSDDGTTISCQCRDLGKILQDTYIETKREYGSEAGTPAQTVIQNILDDNLEAEAPTLYTPSDPGFDIKPYEVDYQSVWDAIQQIAKQIGWFLGYLWDNSTNQWRLTFKEPPRTKNSIDYLLTAENDIYSRNLAFNDSSIRNAVTVEYIDSATDEVQTVTVTDADSIDEFRRRAMTIGTKDTPLIDTSTEATNFAGALLSDLKQITSTSRIQMPLFTDIDLFSTLSIWDPRIESSMGFYAVESLKHIINPASNQLRTEVITAGKVVGSKEKWLEMETRPGADGNPTNVDGVTNNRKMAEPIILDYQGIYRGFTITLEKPTFKGWDGFEVHASTSSPTFTPSESTLVSKGKQAHFEVGGLQGNTTYYVKVIAYDIEDNKSPAAY